MSTSSPVLVPVQNSIQLVRWRPSLQLNVKEHEIITQSIAKIKRICIYTSTQSVRLHMRSAIGATLKLPLMKIRIYSNAS